MPHIIVKLWPGKSEQQKHQLAGRITASVTQTLGCGEESVSIALEEIPPADWAAMVYRPDIAAQPGKLYKKPGYSM